MVVISRVLCHDLLAIKSHVDRITLEAECVNKNLPLSDIF